MRDFSVVCLPIFLVFLAQLIPVGSRSGKQFVQPEITASVEEKSRVTSDSSEKKRLHLQEDYFCNCRNYCPDPNLSEFERVQWIENNPISCKEVGRIDVENRTYLASCFFYCCRDCNVEYFKCVFTDVHRETCSEAAYKCARICVKESLLNIKIKGW